MRSVKTKDGSQTNTKIDKIGKNDHNKIERRHKQC